MEALVLVIVMFIFSVCLWLKNKTLKKVIFFLDKIGSNNKKVNSTNFLASLGVKNLEKYSSKLIIFYQTIFNIADIAQNPLILYSISNYILRIDNLKDSKEKECLKKYFRQALITGGVESFAFILYECVKIKDYSDSGSGKIIKKFIFSDTDDLWLNLKNIDLIIEKINFYEQKDSLGEKNKSNVNQLTNELKLLSKCK